ncbi:MAG TPA: 50S ribosomal protein L6, partial [bacterium]|nr:50S ribosomal protein L6 [bacterium]
MSKVGKIPVIIPDGVTVKLEGRTVSVKGKKGELSFLLPEHIVAVQEEKKLIVSRDEESKRARSLHGTSRALLANMIEGVSAGFKKSLEIQGVGYRVQHQADKLMLELGYSHTIEYKLPSTITAKVEKNIILLESCNKELLGRVACEIRKLRP